VNWFLYLAAIFAARDGDETFAAIPKAVGLVRRNVGAFLGTGAVFGTIHAVLFAFFAITWLLALSLAGKLPRMPTAIVLVSITLAYFALYDFFSISRLAMYVALDEHDRTPPAAPVVVNQVPMPPGPGPPLLPEPIPEPEGNTS
jgi:hypothetical protein